MKNKFILGLTLLVVAISSCKKDKDTEPTPAPAPANCMIKTIITDDGSLYEYTFNDKNQMISSLSVSNGDTSIESYTYTGNQVVIDDGSGMERVAFLNSFGLSDSMHIGLEGLVDIGMKINYDVNGYPTTMVLVGEVLGNSIEQSVVYTYTNGNLMKSIVNNGTNEVVTTYTYDMNKVNMSKKSLETIYFNRANANLVLSTNSDDGSSSDYVYELDKDGKVVKETITDETLAKTVNQYVWGCK